MLAATAAVSLGLASWTGAFFHESYFGNPGVSDPETIGRLVLKSRHGVQEELEGRFLTELAEIPGDLQIAASTKPVRIEVRYGKTAVRSQLAVVSANYFEVLGAPIVAGRSFQGVLANGDELILSSSVASRLFSLRPAESLGQQVVVNGRWFHVIGITADQLATEGAEAWAADPLRFSQILNLPVLLTPSVQVWVRAGAGKSLGATREMLAARRTAGLPPGLHFSLQSLSAARLAGMGPLPNLLAMVTGAVLVFLALNTVLATCLGSLRRARENAVRLALGASPRAILRRTIWVDLRTHAIPWTLGAIAGYFLLREAASRFLGPEFWPLLTRLHPLRAAAAGAALAASITLVSSLLSTLLILRASPESLLKSDYGSASAGFIPVRTLRAALLLQIALGVASALLASLFLDHMSKRLERSRVSDWKNVVVGKALLTAEALTQPRADALLSQLNRAAGVRSSALMTFFPQGSGVFKIPVVVASSADSREVTAAVNEATRGFAEVLNWRLKHGAIPADWVSNPAWAVVDETFLEMAGEKSFGNLTLRVGGQRRRICAVLERLQSLGAAPPAPMVFVPIASMSAVPPVVTVVTRSERPEDLTPHLSAALQSSELRAVLQDTESGDAIARRIIAGQSLMAFCSGLLALATFCCAAASIYAVARIDILRRRTETAVRLALGEQPRASAIRLCAPALLLAVGGCASGSAAAFVLTRSGLLPEVLGRSDFGELQYLIILSLPIIAAPACASAIAWVRKVSLLEILR